MSEAGFSMWRLVLLPLSLSLACEVAIADALVLFDAKVYTGNRAQPQAEAVLSIDGRIAAIGSSQEVLARAPADARRIDLEGRTVLPGLTDAHAHLADIGFRELEFNLEGVGSLAEFK